MHKYLIIDDETNLAVGYCADIVGLLDVPNEENSVYDMILVGLEFTQVFMEHCRAVRSNVSGILIRMLDQEGKGIGSYFFGLQKPLVFHQNSMFQQHSNVHVSGDFASAPSFEAMKIWEQWMVAKPVQLNTWGSLSETQRLGWLEVVRVHSNYTHHNMTEHAHFYLDMTDVTDSISFYCALGEAMNGPGGYYGFNLDSVEDCLCGGFGAVPPFSLHYLNGDLDQLVRSGNLKQEDQYRLEQLKEIFIRSGITLVVCQ